MTTQRRVHAAIDEAHRQDIKLLISRERALLTLSRKHHRFQAWLAVAGGVGALAQLATDPHEVLRRVSEFLKTKLAFQRVLFFEQGGTALWPVAFESEVGWTVASIAPSVAKTLAAARDGHSLDSNEDRALKRAVGLSRFLWHWANTARSRLLVIAGYDRERAPFYAGFDETDRAQFALLGAQLDLVLGGMGSALHDASPRGISTLSTRERDVSQWLARGKSNKEIASILGISPRTVQTHVDHIFDKVGVRSRAGVAGWLVEHNVVGA